MDNVTAIVQQHPAQLAPFFTPEQERMVLNMLGGATKEEAQVLLATVARRRLDPFSKQVYFVKRYDMQKRMEVWAIQTSIDGLRAIAERTGKYDGQDEPVYGEDEAGKFCKVKVYRKDWSAGRGVVGIAYLAEFIQKKKDGTVTQFWARMPRLMLAKCAEALALRKAFPEDTAGLYIAEEMPEAAPAAEVQAEPKRIEAVHVEAQVVEVNPEPAPDPKALPPPPFVAELWKRAKETYADDAKRLWSEAAAKVGLKKPSNEWAADECAKVEVELYPDIQF
jgi:phage recombination protein Bet